MTSLNKISHEEVREFRAAVADAIPLPPKPVRRTPKPKPHARFTRAAVHEILVESLSGLPDPSEPLIGDGLFYAKPGVQDRVLRKLRRGHFSVGAELDLHGLRSEDARLALAEFLQQARGGRVRCVCIIHGKGYRSGPRGPVLKQKLNGWLRQHDGVMAFCSARPADGGTGAVYVLLSGR
ncbi:MAG: Smr/MutS family protein [Gammaproteobacteria bacterium]|nr:Smr/MutS family protein [Gammaproteobacteria bacterium]